MADLFTLAPPATSSLSLKLSALGVILPLQRCESDCATICDADGRDVFTVDANGNRPDEEAEQIAVTLMAAINSASAMGVL
ncbi:hypothetical protein IB237_23455 [Agrobacterium sp. AGB01]|uniref:hypothetical protein n=1 Tax=Agrobacterium sp. AGB01 TaxID=2769302 RepID=UPI0017815ADD|nr:hypothetical protein [Agrobacterium sp. AGB01]MBD9390162.1 hypothetical protein [Agrobacterium sp. AGB01]